MSHIVVDLLSQLIAANFSRMKSFRGGSVPTFLFVPPVDESLGPLNTWRWVLISSSFVVSVILFMLAISSHHMFALLLIPAATITAIPMQIYAQNRLGRMVGILFIAVIGGITWYSYANWIRQNSHVVLIVLGFWWVVWSIYNASEEARKAGDLILRRLDTLEEKLGEIEQRRIGL